MDKLRAILINCFDTSIWDKYPKRLVKSKGLVRQLGESEAASEHSVAATLPESECNVWEKCSKTIMKGSGIEVKEWHKMAKEEKKGRAKREREVVEKSKLSWKRVDMQPKLQLDDAAPHGATPFTDAACS